ncbi:unnamed protein product [Brassica rapa subsp. trilocularis]|uniref:(rape) hypothetical protein n=1 Tax=Brassica napus TaxID=3708 RepID=A0A816WZT2_BRANA|nr:unnamed protein product [Brassica napus]
MSCKLSLTRNDCRSPNCFRRQAVCSLLSSLSFALLSLSSLLY